MLNSNKNPVLKRSSLAFVEGYYALEYGQKGSEKNLDRLLDDMKNDLKNTV